MANESPLEQFKQVLTGTARAIAHEPEVELAFTADAPTQAGKNFKVPMPGRLLPPEQVAEARGFADSFALKLKHHNAARHAALRPSEAIAGAAFDAVENARVEALGSRNMRLQRRLMAQQNRSWMFDLEEGVLDTARLTRVIVDPTAPLSFKMEDESKFRDTVVTLLLDNSGSMRGRPIMVAAICADIWRARWSAAA
jgi:cobalamin biosynthesis protein CobT